MNAIYKVIWNDALRLYQVVNEMCRSRRKGCSVKAVHVEGSSLGISNVLKAGAMAGTLGLMTLGTPVWAAPYNVPEFTWSMGAGQITSGTFEPGIDALPVAGSNDRIVVDLSKVSFTDIAQLIYGQDENSSFAALIGVDRDYMISWDEVPLVFHDANGNETNQFTYGTGFASFKYELGAGWTTLPSGEWVIGLTRRLAEIDLTSTDNWQYIDAGEEKDVDLSAKITGNGNITFGFSATGDAEEGWLTLNSDAETDEFKQVNDYTGVTRVGYTLDASESDPTHLVFGMTEAFGDTSMLMVSSNSEVLFGGINSDKAYTQIVGGLSGTGTLNLGLAAHLTLKQSVVQGVTSAPTTDEPGKLGILNNILGTGATNPESGAVLNVVLDGDVKDYEVVFTDQNVTVSDDQVDFSGLITLTNSAVTAYKNGRSDTVGGQEYADVNKILTGATLQLKSNGLLRVDSTGELNNLIISSGAGGIEFSGLGNVDADGEGALMINGDLTFDGADATVSIKDFDYNIGDAAAGMDLIDADDGLLNTLVHVKVDVVGEENYGFVLDEESQQEPVVSAITDDSGTTIASGTWVLEDELLYDGSGNFDLVYKLTQVDIKEDQTLTISGSDKASEASKTQDFTAKITGSGNIVFDAADNATGSGTRIEIGDASTTDKNDYTGSTTVTDGTTLVLTEDDAMGQTSDLIAYGNVEIGRGIEQIVKNINSSGTGTISIDDSGKLTVDASGDQTINNIISGAGDLNIDLGGSDNKLVFGNSGQGSSFTGDLSLGNGRFSLDDGQNEAFAGSSSIVLGSGAVFDFGSGTSNIKDLTVNAHSKLESSALVIGSDTAPHNISGSFNLNSDTTITLTGVSVETDLSLTDYDGGSVSQDFITAGNVTVGADAEITLSGSGDFINLGNLVLDYQQTQNGSAETVAETVWSVNGSLTQNGNAFQVGTQLKEIRLIGNTILSGSGTSNELSALVTDSDKDGSHSLQFSSADGTQTSFTIVDYAGDSVVGNSYTGATTVDSNVTVTLGTNNGFGSTSLLTAQGNVTLSDGVTQTVKGLSGTGTITLGSGAALKLDQTGSASVGNILAGTGEFIVHLGAKANELSFTNSGAGAFGGTVSLSDGTVRLASGTATQTVLSGADLALDTNGRLIVSGSGTDRRELGGLTLKGDSQIDFSSVSMGDANSNNAQLHVSGSFTINGSNDVSVGGINLDGTQNILAADDANGGLKQALVTADGGIDLSSGQLVIDLADTSMKSEIKNSGSDKTVAYGVWSAGSGNDVFNVEGNTLYAYLRLSEIQLADTTDGLKLNASGLSTDTTLSAKITDYKTTAGKIVFEGGNITIGGSNTYTGETEVTGGTVTLAKNSGFGTTSKLSIASGAKVDIGGYSQTVGSLVVGSRDQNASNALRGSGTLTLGTGQIGASQIWGSNSFTGTIQLAANHNLAINSIAGIGGTATVGFGDNSVLTIDGASGGTFSTRLSGAGTVAVANSTFDVSGNNTAFTGTWQLGSSGNVSVSGTSTGIDNALGSGATLSFSGGSLSLKLAAGESALTIDEVLSGDGSLVVKGTTGQTFGLSSSRSDFAGTLSLDGIGMTVGGVANSIGAHNASAFRKTDLSLIGDALLTVASGNGAASTFSDLTVSGGAIRFEGTAGFNADTSSLAELNISGSLNLQSGDIKLTLPGDAEDLTGVLSHSEIIASQSNKFEGLINASGGITGSLDNITINGSGSDTSFSGTQNITGDLAAGGTGNVAYAQYGYKLGTSGNSLGLIFNLSEIDIVGGETLVLTESGALSAVVKNYGTGAGNLTVASGATIELTNKNAYTGVTTVEGTLTAGESGVGNTSELRVESGGRFVNAGANSVGHLVVDAHGTLELSTGQTLGIKQADGQTSTISGAILGAGSLNLDDGELVVHANSGTSGESGWSGTINVGDSDSDAVLTLSGAGALGSGAIVLANSGSVININESTGLTFSNAISGYGTINVNLSGGAFAFGTNQSGLATGTKLNFLDATFSLDDANNAAVAGSTLIGLSRDSQLISSGESDKNVWGLDLTSGGTIDFGQIDGSGGQLVLSSNDGTWSGSGRIDLSSNNQTTVVFEDGTSQQTGNRFDELNSGSALLSGGGVFDLTLFEGVSDVYLNGSQITGSGTVSISGFQTDGSFSGTGENYYQDADGDGTADDLVAKLYRGGSGSFYYDADEDVIYMRYGIRQIDLQYSDSGRGLRLAADGNGGELSADVTGSGNIVYAGGNIRVSGSIANDYRGSTYVESGASVTLGKTDAFGKTDYLEIAEGGSVSLADGLSQVVGELAGSGSLSLGSGSSFTINNSQRQDGKDDPVAKDEIVIETAITASSGSTFVINGSGAATADRRASVNFAKDASLSGANFSLENAQLTFDLSDSGNYSYVSVNDTSKFTLGSNSALLIDARNGSASQNYQLNNTLTLSGGLISFDDVLFTTGNQGTTAILNVGTLDVTDVGYIGVSAAIDDNFNILDADTSHFTQALIHYENETEGSRKKLEAATSDQMDDSAISNATGDPVAYVEWSGGFVDKSESPENTIVMSYQVAKLKLAQGGDAAGLVLDATGHDSELSVLITDDEQAGSSGGNITFAGGDIRITNSNEYTGVTTVETGSATLGADNGFGNTRLLDVVSGYVNFGGFSQTLGSIDVKPADGIRGSGSVTLGSDAYQGLHSLIRGEQSAFTGNVTLTNGHTLELSDTLGIGSSGTVVLKNGTRLVINDQSADNTFSKVVIGEAGATVELSGSGFNIYANNTNYLGDWSLTSGTIASVSGSSTVGVDSILGSGGTVALGTDATLALSQDSGSIVVDNVFAGAGTLVVSGTADQEFGFSTNWTDAETSGFTGTLSLEDGIKMTVGGGSGSGFYNAANLANADFKLESGSTLVVATQTGSRVDTFDNLNVNSGTISFAGKFDLGATTEELGQLQVGSLTGSGNIALTIPDANGTVDQTIGQNDLLTIDDVSHFQALITAETGTVSKNGWTLNGSTTTTGSGLRQAVRNAKDTDTVAHAIYDYALATGNVNSESDSLGIEYKLTTVDILSGKKLELSDSGTLRAVITDRSGAGTLLITGQIKLTGQNEYDSVTQVTGDDASLTVGSSGLGNTAALKIEGGASFINEGTNSVGYLNASGSNIKLNEALTLTGGNVSEIVGGTISGTHALNVQKNQLQVSGNINADDFSGNVNLGDGNNGAILELDGVAGIGTGSVNFVTGTSSVSVKGTTGTSLTNTYSGGGKIAVNLGGSGNVFDFSDAQAKNGASGAFTGLLVLENAGYHLYDDAGELASATLLTSGGGYVTVNAGSDIADHKVDGLSLYGGTLDFGLMTEGSKSGQIVVGSEGFATNASTTVVKVALGENNNATGSDVFDLNSDLSVLLIEGEGFDATGRDLTSLDFSGSANVVQQVKQSGRFADGSATAELTYSNGHLVGNKEGIGASWTLSQINLLSGNGDVLSGSGEGFLIDASNESSQSGTISALITGEGSIEFAGGTITLNHANNTYTGNTYVTDGKLELAANEALGDSALLEVTSSGTVSVGSTAQSIGRISVAGENGLSMAGGSLTLTSGASTISSANNDVSGTVALSGSNTTLTIQNASGVGGSATTISLDDKTSVIFAVSGFADGGTFAKINNKLSGAGTVQIGNGTDKMYLELLNTNNAFGKLLVTKGATVLVNDLNADNALGDAAVDIQAGGIARLYGSSGWTITNDLTLVKDGELELSAGGGVVNFAGTPQQNISGGKVTLQTSVLYLGGSSGAANAAVLDTAHLNVGSNGVLHVATGNDAQVLDKLTLGSSGHIWFDGTLGVSGTGTTQLGQLKVGSLGDMKGTIHLTASSAAGSGGEIKAAELLNVADNGSFQSLIEVTGTDETITNDELSGTNIDVSGNTSGNTSVVSDIKDGSGNTVAEGTFDFGDTLVAKDDKYAGVQYELQLIKLLKTLEISDSGSLDVRISGSGNLLVSNALTLTNKEGETNDYSGSTTVAGTGSLVAGTGALGKTSALNVSGSFTNSGDNTVGIFDLSGSSVLNKGTLLTVLGTTGETNDFTGTLSGSGSLALESGKTVVSQNNSGYAGNVVLGKDGGLDAEIHFNAGASLGMGTITFADNLGVLSVEASGDTTLTNKLLTKAGGDIVVVGNSADDVFAFRDDQVAGDFKEGTTLSLQGTSYDLTTKGNDILQNVALTMTGGKLTVNSDLNTGNRLVGGLTIGNAVIDFGQIGGGAGAIDLQGKGFDVTDDTTVTLNAKLASVADADGSAAFVDNVSGAEVTLVTNADGITDEELAYLESVSGKAVSRDLVQKVGETDTVVAKLKGEFSDFSVSGESGHQNLNVGLGFNVLEIQNEQTYTVSSGGTIGLKITDEGQLGGGLTVTGANTVLKLSNSENDYRGATNVKSGADLVLADDNVLGNTGALNTDSDTSVHFGDTNQTVGAIHASGLLVSDAEASGKLTITAGGDVSGANEDFHLDVDLTGSEELMLTDVAALGNGNTINIANNGTELILANADGNFTNNLNGAGSLRISAGSDVALTGKNDLTGGLAVDASGKVSAGGNIYDHIGTGTVALAGEADFTLESQDTADWTWNNTVTCSGDLTLARDGSGSRDLLFKAGSLSDFDGTLTLDNWTIDLSETGGIKNATLGEIYGSDLTDLTLKNGAQATVTGEVGLENKKLTLVDNGRLTFNGVSGPGSMGSSGAHITVNELHLESGFNIDLGIQNARVDSSDLLLQDSGVGTTIDVATAINGIEGDLAKGTVSVNGGSSEGKTIRFDVSQLGSGAESGHVADAIYSYEVGEVNVEGSETAEELQISYRLEGIDISGGMTLVLAGDEDDPSGNASTLSVYLTGDGNLRIADNTVRLSSKLKKGKYDYKGTTTVTSGATLYAEAGTLGETARLTTESGAQTHIEGDNTVRGITLASGGQLAIGSSDSMSGSSDVTLTIVSSTDGTTSADQINHLYGDLHGHGDLKVVGNGQVDEGVAADLTIHGSQTTFYGDLVLTNGAWVDIAATDSSLFGNSSAGNKVKVYKDSLLTIESDRSGDASFYGVFTDGEDGSGGGTVEISLLNTSDHFRFAAAQSKAGFTGTFVLNSGTIDFTDLFTSTDGSGDPLAGATLVLNDGGVVDLVGDGSGTSASNERKLGGLTMAGGTIEAGSIGYKEGEGAFNSTINLGGSGTLTLESAKGTADDRQSTVVLGTTDDAIQISDSGSEILNAGSVGANVTVISGIGDLVLVNGDKSETVSGSKVIDSDYLHAERPANGTAQEIEQKVILANGSSEYRSVAETVRTYDENFTYNSESGTLSIGYKVSDLGLLYETGNVSGSNYAEDSRWQGLTITANAAADGTSVFDVLIKDGENGNAAGNIVFKGADGKGTITLAGDENTYTGKTWLTENAQVVFETDSGFGNTAALRVDSGSSVDFAGHDQSMGALFALGDDALKSTDGANLAVDGTAIINGANANLHADWTFSGSVTIGDELSLGDGAVELAGTTTLTIAGSEANGTIDNAITGGELTNIYVTSGANVSFANADILSGPNFTGNIAVWSGASAGFAIESGATVSNGLTIGSTGKVSFESTSGGTLAFEDANIYGTLELNNVTFDLDAHGDAFNRGSSLVANAGTRIDVSDAVSGAVSNITLNSGSTVAFDNGTPGAAGEGEVASINLGSSGTLTLAGDVTVDLDINDYADASDVEDAQGDLINRPLTAQDLTGQDGGAVLATLIAGQVASDTADLNLKTDGKDVESNKLDIAIRNAANGEEVATGTYDYKLVLDKDGSGSGLKLSYGLTEVTIHDDNTLELTGTSADEDDNELTAAVKGTGNLRITEGEVTLVDKDSDYTGSTSVAAGAALVAGSAGHTLGQTSELRLEGATGVVSGASATILGKETVYGLNVQSGATLNLAAGSGEGAGAVLTVAGGEDDNVIAGNDALGQGGGELAVSGDGTKLTVEGANSRFTGATSVESGAVLSLGNGASLGTGNTEIAAGGTLEVASAVDATSGASRVASQLTNSVTGAGDVVINLSGTAQAAEKMFSFADDQTSGFSGNIVLENGGYTLAYANDGDAEDDYTANQFAAMNARITVEENGHLYVSTVNHQVNRYIDKHVRALTLDGGNIYFGGLRYDMTSMDESLGGQLQLAGDTDKSATLEIKSQSFVNLDAGATNTLTDGSELLVADEGAKIDLIQNAADVVLGSGADTIWASSSDEADFTDLLNDYLKLNTVNSDAEQTLTQDGRDVAIVTRDFGSNGHDEVFGVEQNDSSAWDLYLNYHVSKIELIDSENTQGLLITNDEAGSDSDLTALLTGSGNLTLSGVQGTTIELGDGSAATQNDYTGRTTVTGSVTVKAAEDNAFGKTYRLNIESGAKVDFGEFDQTLGILEARGDDALAGTADSVVTITDDMIVTGKNDDFHSQVRLEFSGTGTVTDVGGLGTGDISIGKDYTLVLADENASDGSLVGNNITGAGTVVIGRDDTTGTIELGGSNAGFTGNVRVESDWTLEASMGKGETTADRIGSGNLVLSNGATGSFTQTEGNLDWTSAVIGEGDLVLSAGKDSDVTISGGPEYFNGDITIGGGRFELASGNGNVENVDGSNLHATGEDTTVVVADQGTVILGDDLSVESGASIVFEGDVTPGTIGDAQLVVAGDLTITESEVTINVGGELDPSDPDTASLNVQDVTSADRSDELALVIAEADNIVLSGNDLVVLGPDGNPINNPEDRLGVSIVDGDEEIATGYYDFGLTSTESGGRDILGVGYQLMEVNVKDGNTLVLNGAHAADVDYENASSFDAAITGEGNFALANGELTLTGKNTYTGSTRVGDGTSETTLTVDRGSSLGDTSAVNVSDNATLVNRSHLTDAGSIQVASGGTVTLEDGSVFKVTDAANESNIAGTLTGSGTLHLNDNVDIDVAADKAQNFTGSVSVGSGAVYNLISTVTDTVTVASRFKSDAGDDAVVGMTGDFSLEAVNNAYHGAFVLSDGTVIRTDSIASLGAADATITTAGDYAEVGGTASQADDNATVILDYADRETVGDVTQTMTSGITFVKTGEGVVELSAESLGAGAVKSSEGGIIFGAAGDSTVYDTALTVESGAWAAGFGGVGSLSVASDGAFHLGGVDGYNSIVSSGWTSSEGSSTVQFTVSGNVTNNGTIYVGNKNSSGDTPADSNYIGNEFVIEGDYITDGGTLDLNAIIAGKDNSKSDHVTIKGEIDGTGFIDVNYDTSVSTGGKLEYLGLVSVAEGESGDSLKLKDSIKIGDLYYRLMWSSKENEYYLQSSVTDPGEDPSNTEDVENVGGGTRSSLAMIQAQTFDLSIHDHIGETLYVDPVTGEERKTTFWMIQRGDWTKFSNASGQLDADGHVYTTHLGADLITQQTSTGTVRWGALASFADGKFDVSSNLDGKSAQGKFRGYSAGGYVAYDSSAENGFFSALQLRYNWFDTENGKDEYDLDGVSITAEAGWDQLISKGTTESGRTYEWRVEPHVRAYWSNLGSPEDYTTGLGETYSSSFDNGLLVRVGARTKLASTMGTGPAVQAYAEANWVYNNGDYSTTVTTRYGDATSTQEAPNFAELRLGFEAQFTPRVNMWVEGHHQTGSENYESSGAMIGFKYRW